ncbi:MAG: hypothetical protein MI794_11150 [Pseudomonadales bacterium]|nr:hypothetical protein [Pseudomonadales bacterium]
MLETLLEQRQALFNSHQAPLSLLRQLDRRLLLWCEHHPDTRQPAIWPLTDGAIDSGRLALLWLETNARLQPATLDTLLAELKDSLDQDTVTAVHWQLAACHSGVSLPAEGKVAEAAPKPETDLWSVMALARRGLEADCPSPWREWLAALEALRAGESVAGTRELMPRLWLVAQTVWPMWFYPLLLAAQEEQRPTLVNWLTGHVDGADVIEAMGASGCAQFEPWLQELAEQGGPDAEVAATELEGLQTEGDDPTGLRLRQRHWWANWAGLEGAPWSLFGGHW